MREKKEKIALAKAQRRQERVAKWNIWRGWRVLWKQHMPIMFIFIHKKKKQEENEELANFSKLFASSAIFASLRENFRVSPLRGLL